MRIWRNTSEVVTSTSDAEVVDAEVGSSRSAQSKILHPLLRKSAVDLENPEQTVSLVDSQGEHLAGMDVRPELGGADEIRWWVQPQQPLRHRTTFDFTGREQRVSSS